MSVLAPRLPAVDRRPHSVSDTTYVDMRLARMALIGMPQSELDARETELRHDRIEVGRS